MKKIRIAINGFGRVGRSFFREAFDLPEFEIAAVNDLAPPETLAYVLKYDSVYGRYRHPVSSREHKLVVNGREVEVVQEKDPALLPWKKLGIDVVIESTGKFASGEKSKLHLDAGARRVVITAPADSGVTTMLVGVNDDRFANAGPITCNASCTTNSVAPVMAILNEALGVKKAGMVTVHAYTASQRAVDEIDARDKRRGRAAAVNIVPATTGAAEAVIQAIPELKGKFDAIAIRVPTVAGSLSVISALVCRATTREEVNDVFMKAAREPRWTKILKVTEDFLVSTDIIGEPFGALVDSTLTKVIDSDLVKIFSWYDNEAGYTATLIEHVKRVAQHL